MSHLCNVEEKKKRFTLHVRLDMKQVTTLDFDIFANFDQVRVVVNFWFKNSENHTKITY